jgi:hypothetical protein
MILNTFLAGYILFGAISLLQAILPGKNGNWSQDYYITLCSLWIAIIPYIFYQKKQTHRVPANPESTIN